MDTAQSTHDVGAKMEAAAREVTAMLSGSPGRWKLDGRRVSEDAADALLSLHDYLNELEACRVA